MESQPTPHTVIVQYWSIDMMIHEHAPGRVLLSGLMLLDPLQMTMREVFSWYKPSRVGKILVRRSLSVCLSVFQSVESVREFLLFLCLALSVCLSLSLSLSHSTYICLSAFVCPCLFVIGLLYSCLCICLCMCVSVCIRLALL